MTKKKRIALITGASSGIGEAIARAFAGASIDLILCGRNQEKLTVLANELSAQVQVCTRVFDVREAEEVMEQLGSLPDGWAAVDILVNNAGNAFGLEPIHEGDLADWDAMLDSNVKGLLYVTKAITPGMVARGSGHIVNMSSIAGKQTYANGGVYCASKAAVEALSTSMRLDLTQHGIRVTNIAPGAVHTPFSTVRFHGDADRAAKVYAGFEPLLAEDIADAVLYAVNVPPHVTIADMTLLAAAQSAATTIHRKS